MKIMCLVGPIASGKSTYCKNAACGGFVIVNDDAIVNMLHADVYSLYDTGLKILYKSVENSVVGHALGMKIPVVIDRGLNCSVRGRKRWLALSESFDVPCEAVIFANEGPEIHARRRTEADSRGHPYSYWLRTAQVHQKDYAEPTREEGFSAIHRISYQEILDGKVF